MKLQCENSVTTLNQTAGELNPSNNKSGVLEHKLNQLPNCLYTRDAIRAAALHYRAIMEVGMMKRKCIYKRRDEEQCNPTQSVPPNARGRTHNKALTMTEG